jgi:hypothetical protein
MLTPVGPYAGKAWVDYWEDENAPMDPVCECGWPGFLCDQRWHEERESFPFVMQEGDE